jgi:hypothetical protein
MTHDKFPIHGNGEDGHEFEPVSEETKKELFELIKTKKDGGHYNDAIKDDDGNVVQSALLITDVYPQDTASTKYGIGYVFEEDRVAINGETLVGTIGQTDNSITLQEKGELDYNGLQEMRVYALYLTPDSTLEIKKMTRLFDRNELEEERKEIDKAIFQQDREKLEEILEKSRKRTEGIMHSVDEYQKRGMGFVPEEEAHNLLERLKEAKPYPPFRNY